MKPGSGGVDRYGDAMPVGALSRLGTVRYRFGGIGTTFLPDSKTVVCAKEGGSIEFWDARTGRRVREINTGRFYVRHLALSRDGERLAVIGSLPEFGIPGRLDAARVYNMASGKEVRTFEQREPRDSIRALALSPDGKLLFSLDGTNNLHIEDVDTGVELLRQQFAREQIHHMTLSTDGSTLALGVSSFAGKVYVWKWDGAAEPRRLKFPGYEGSPLAFSPDGKRLADCNGSNMTVRVWKVDGGGLLHKLELPDHERYRHSDLAFSPDGKIVAASAWTNDRRAVHFWDSETGRFQARLAMGGRNRAASESDTLAFSPDGTLLAVGSRIWDLKTGKELSANDEAHRGDIDLVLAAGRDTVVTAAYDDTIRAWDAGTGKHVRTFPHHGWIRDIALSPDRSLLVSNSLDDTVCLWDFATGKKTYALAGHGRLGGQRAAVFTPDGKSFLAWGDDMYLRKWDVRTGKALAEHRIRPTGIPVPEEASGTDYEDFLGRIRLGQFSPDGRHLVLQLDKDFFVFDTATGKELRKFATESDWLNVTTVSPNGKLLLASAWATAIRTVLPDGTVHFVRPPSHPVMLWDLTTGQQKKRIYLSGQTPGPVAFSQGGKRFAVASSEPGARIRVMETETSREVLKIEGFRGIVRSLAFLSDGRRLISGMDDGTALVWDAVQKP